MKHGVAAQISQDLATDYEYTADSLVVGIAGTFVLVMARRQTAGSIAATATSLFIIFYLGVLAQYIVRLRMQAASGAARLAMVEKSFADIWTGSHPWERAELAADYDTRRMRWQCKLCESD